MSYIVEIKDPKLFLCTQLRGPFGRMTRCGEPAEFVEIRRKDWKQVHPRCNEHLTRDLREWVRVPIGEGSQIQQDMITKQSMEEKLRRIQGSGSELTSTKERNDSSAIRRTLKLLQE